MFNNLLESKAKKQKSWYWNLTSAGIVAGLTALAVIATAQAATETDKPREEKIQFTEVKPEEPPPKDEPPPPPPPKDVVVAPPPPKGFQVLQAPIDIPDVIPEIDLSKKVTDEADFSGKGVAGGTSKGVVGGVPRPNNDQPFFEFQVEKPADKISGPTPQFPDILRSANVTGRVIAQFVVNTDGRADMSTFKALESDHELFTAAVKRVLPQWRFIPAETGGQKVRQLVQLPFEFALQK